MVKIKELESNHGSIVIKEAEFEGIVSELLADVGCITLSLLQDLTRGDDKTFNFAVRAVALNLLKITH